ncbi:PilZ domain-containing protein [bacterium]|nr:PilZ domain-containing protein [bacterium]
MRELVVEGQEVLIIPQNFKYANKGIVKEVRAGDFDLELDYAPEGLLVNTYCEFYTQTPHGKLYFDSFAREIKGNTLVIASPAKHKFLQRRQYTRIKYVHDCVVSLAGNNYNISTMDISAGGLKFKTNDKIDIEGSYAITIPIWESQNVECVFKPIRIEKRSEGGYTVSGQFEYGSSRDKMVLTQFCAKRSVEIKNK